VKLVIGIGGASGAPYARRLLQLLRDRPAAANAEALDVAVVLSRTAEQVWAHECGGHPRELGFPIYTGSDYSAPFASGSAGWQAMAVVPASMGCIARIAHGISDDLLTRAADVMLKERRKLILMPREAPYSELHLENMLRVTRAGALVIPASPSFYGRPRSLTDALDSVLARVCDHLGVAHALGARWGQDIELGSDPSDPQPGELQEE
jgi:4-hydroxy-3-polyprenylbenzoate decarboxylase